jgi:hypothetical protein
MREPRTVRSISAIPLSWFPTSKVRLERLTTSEGQQLRSEFGGAIRRIRDRVEVARPLVLGQRWPSQQLCRRSDDSKQIIEVVRYAAGELPDRLQLLHLADLTLSRQQFLRALLDVHLEAFIQPAQLVFGLALPLFSFA